MDKKENKMFCFQCQETAGCSGCTVSGVCGKKPDVAAMQDLLVYVTKGISAVTTQLRSEGKEIDDNINHQIIVNLFTTITNANFDKESIITRIKERLEIKEELQRKVKNKVDKHQKEYLLREQLKVIREELGEDTTFSDADEFEEACSLSLIHI